MATRWRIIVAGALVLFGCEEDPVQRVVPAEEEAAVTVTLSPSSVTVPPMAERWFEAIVDGADNPGVTWSTTGGTLSFLRDEAPTSHLVRYTAPDTAGAFELTATSVEDPTISATSTITVRLTPIVTVLPTTAVMAPSTSRTFSATVENAADTSVEWSATAGTITGDGNEITFEAPAETGTVFLTATSVADTMQSSTAAISVVTGVEEVRGALTADTVWSPDRVYIVVEDLIVPSGRTLTIEPGTVVKFFRPESAPNTPRYEIRVEGSLSAVGDPGTPIVFTSLHDDTAGGDTNADGDATFPAARDWESVRFESGSSGELRNVVGRYGGGVSRSLSETVGLFYVDGASVSFDGVTVENTAWSAISAGADDEPTITGFSAEDVPLGGLEVRGGELTGTRRWASTEIIYILSGDLRIAEAATLVIAEGVVVKALPSASGDFFRPRLEVAGRLETTGTASDPVIFTSLFDDDAGGDTGDDGGLSTARPRDWEGLRFDGGDGSLSNLEVRYAGGESGSSSGNVGAVTLVEASPTISGLTVRHAAWSAISQGPSDAPLVSGLVVEDVPIGGIEIRSEEMTSDATWSGGDVPYVLTGNLVVPEGRILTIGEGSVVKALRPSPSPTSPRFGVVVEGQLDVAGSDPSPVIFTSLTDDGVGGDTNGDGTASEPGVRDWEGIRFDGGTGSMLHAELRFAGGVSGSATDSRGAIRLEGSSPSFDELVVRDAAWSAISAGPGDQPEVGVFTAIRTPIGGIEIRGESLEADAVWNQQPVVYVVTGDVTVPSGRTLTIAAGTVVKFWRPTEEGDSERFRLVVLGRLDVDGTSESRVTFTSLKDDVVGGDTNGDGPTSVATVRDWQSIEFAGGEGSIQYADFRYGGAQTGTFSANRGAIHVIDASPTIMSCSLRSNTYAIQAVGTLAAPVISGCNIQSNTLFGAIATGGAVITATENWWGSADGPGGEGGGNGDPVTTNVSFDPFLTAPAF